MLKCVSIIICTICLILYTFRIAAQNIYNTESDIFTFNTASPHNLPAIGTSEHFTFKTASPHNPPAISTSGYFTFKTGISGFSQYFTYNTLNLSEYHYISGIVKNASTGVPILGATVRTLSYSSMPTNSDGSYKIFLPYGYGYNLYATAPQFSTHYVNNIDVPGSDSNSPVINFDLESNNIYTSYRFSTLSQAPNPAILEIPKGGTGYAWFVVEGQTSPGIWLPVPNAIIGVVDGQGNPVVNKNGQSIQSNQLIYSFLNNPLHIESYGHFCVPVKSEIIQDGSVDQQEQITLVSVNGQAVTSGNQNTFIAKVVPYDLTKSWGFRVYAKGGLGAGSITGIARSNAFAGGGMGSGIKVKFNNPDNTTDWSAFQVTRTFDLFGGLEASFGPPDLLNLEVGVNTGITASVPYQGEYDFVMEDIAGLEAALAFYLFYEPTILLGSGALPGGQIGVAFLSWLVQALIANQGQNGLGIARISDASGLDIKGHINAEVGVGFDVAKSLKLGMNASLGAHAHFGAFIQKENYTNTKNSKFYLGGGYDISTGIGPKFIGQNNTKTKFMYLSRLNQSVLPSQLDVEFGITNVKQDNNWKKIDLEAAIESNSELLNMYNLPGQRQKYTAQLSVDQQDVRNWLLNVAEIPNELANIGTTAINVAIDNNSFKNDMERFLEKIYDEQNDDAPVLLDYHLKAEDKNEYKFDLTVQFPLIVFPAIDIVIGGGLEANNVTEYDLAEGFWVKGYPYLRTELPNPVNPNLSFNNVMNELWQNVINKDIWEELKNVIIAQISNSKFIKWFSGKSTTQLVLLNENGSTLEIRQNSIPPTIDSMYCRQWDWNQEPTRALSDAEKVLQYKQYAKALRTIREEAVGMRYGIGGFYKFEPSTGSFTDTTKLTIAYSDAEIDGFDENSLAMYWEDSLGVWRHIPSIIEPDSNRVAAWIEYFGTYTLAPRMPYGNYGLQTQPDSIPSDGNTVAMIYSPVLLNNDSSMIADNSLFTVETSRGTILSEDIAPDLSGIQVAVQNGIISFELISDSVATPIYLSARSVTGYAICEGILKLYDTIAPTAPQNVSAVAGLNSVFVSWEKVNDADVVGYKIYYDTDTIAPLNGIHTVVGEPSPIEIGIGTNQNIIGLFNDSTYYFAVSAIDISGNESPLSDFVYASPGFKYIEAKIFLEGPISGVDTMHSTLNTGNLVPLNQPYNQPPWNYSGTESVVDMPSNAVDWVLIELRQAASPELAIEATILPGWPKAMLLRQDGSIKDVAGETPKMGTAVGNDLYIVIRHRNHLDVMSSAPLSLSGNTYSYNFTDAVTKAFGGAAGYKQIGTGVFGMVAGDIDADGAVFASDFNLWAINFGLTTVYLPADVDMDGQVFASDFNKWSVNFGTNMGGKVNVYKSQVPE